MFFFPSVHCSTVTSNWIEHLEHLELEVYIHLCFLVKILMILFTVFCVKWHEALIKGQSPP